MDNEFRLDLAEAKQNLQTAEVISLFFALVRKTLLIDTRSNELEGPMVRIVPMASSLEERLNGLQRLRPRFSRPDSIAILPWPKYVGSLKRLGLWDEVLRRFAEGGYPETVQRLEALYRELQELESHEIRHAVTGEGYGTLWPPG